MRDDMSKVLVEEPRRGRAFARAVAGARRQGRNRLDRDGESAPAHLGMKGDRFACKEFGEHLGPLYRYLRQQVNRPWHKVHGELCAALDRRSTVQAHLFEHIRDKIDTETVWHADAVWVRNWRGLVPLAQSWAEMYVHPNTGILLFNRARAIAERQRKERRAEQALARDGQRRIGAPDLPLDVQWHCVDGLWYEVRLRELGATGGDAPVYDAVLKRSISSANRELLAERYGSGAVYAAAKRQLDGRTLRRHGLAVGLR